MRKYALLNPADGTYTYHETLDALRVALAKRMFDIYLMQVHGSLYSVVDVNDETGAQTWSSPTGESQVSPQETLAELEKALKEYIESQQAP